MGKITTTQGEITITPETEDSYLGVSINSKLICTVYPYGDGEKAEAEANGALIADVLKVRNKSGLTASELLQQRDELLMLLIQGRDMCDKLKFPTESELKEFSAKANMLIQKIENHETNN